MVRLSTANDEERAALVEELAVTNVALARRIARRLGRHSQHAADLEQVAYLAYLGSDKRDDEVADGVPLRSCLRPHSLDAPDAGTAAPLSETLVDVDDRTWEQTEARLILAPHLNAPPAQARHVLHRRFVEDRTQQQIADELGLSQYHVSRLLDRYLRQLRERMTEPA